MLKRLTTELNKWFQRNRIVRNLEVFQDFIIISLCLGLFCVMLIRLGDMFFSFLHPLDLRQVTSDILFILILVELFRLLIIAIQYCSDKPEQKPGFSQSEQLYPLQYWNTSKLNRVRS